MAAQAGGGQQDPNADKNSYYILWMMALVGVVVGMIWYFFAPQLKMFFIGLRKYELIVIYFFTAFLPYPVIQKFFPGFPDLSERIAKDLILVRKITPENLTFDIAETLSTVVGQYLSVPFVILLVWMAYYVYKHHILMRFTQRYSTNSLARQESENWPQIKIVSKLDLLSMDLDEGPWAMTLTPMQYSKKNKLAVIEFADQVGSGFSKVQAAEFKVTLDRMRAERAMAAQLGRPWQGAQAMAPHRRAIFAVLIAKGCRDSKKAQQLIYQLAGSAGDGNLDLSGADDLWKKHYKNKAVEKICASHAYEFTVMASLLQFAREDGVLASADFLWVKPLDRRLWYVINNVGRQTPAAEVAGIFCHWYNELALKRPLSMPIVDAAVDALALALSEILYIPDDKEREEIIKRRDEQLKETTAESQEESL
jgi:intracellular multiplication protein IcmP